MSTAVKPWFRSPARVFRSAALLVPFPGVHVLCAGGAARFARASGLGFKVSGLASYRDI